MPENNCGGNPDLDLAHRVLPYGTRKLPGQEREYMTATQLWLSREKFKEWSRDQGKETDPIMCLCPLVGLVLAAESRRRRLIKLDEDKGFGCCDCGGEASEDESSECIDQDLAHRVIPCGTRKLAGQGRQYRTTTGKWLSREEFKAWAKEQGIEVDPIVWFTEMGHGPVPEDVKS